MVHLEVMAGTTVVSRHAMSARPFTVGRGPENDLVLADETVSARHFCAWLQDGRLVVSDASSRNGTWRNGVRVAGTFSVASGDWLRVGERAWIRVVEHEQPVVLPELWDAATGEKWAFERDRVSFADMPGIEPSGDLPWLVVEPDGEIWLESASGAHRLGVDETFLVQGRPYCLRLAVPTESTTLDSQLAHELPRTRYAYILTTRIDGVIGPEACLTCGESRRTLRISADNPALLMYILGRKFAADVTHGMRHDDAGWCHDEEVAVGIWGGAQAPTQLANLNVLIWRLRREISHAGLDPACVEKRKRHLRLRIERAELH